MSSLLGCLSPRYVKNPYNHDTLLVPCGKCESCLSKRSQSWITRLQLEAEQWKYVFFFTLTFNESNLPRFDLRSVSVDDTPDYHKFSYAMEDCADFCALHDFKIPYFPVRLLQLFIKRLRKRLYVYEEENPQLRYFISTEYGPTTFRPHCHGLLFFNSLRLSRFLEVYIRRAWSNYDPVTHQFTPYGSVDVQAVQSDAVRYVAQYSTFVSNLPSILQIKPLRPFAIFSKHPPLGSSSFTDKASQEVFHRGLTTFSYVSPDSGEVVTSPLWRTFRHSLFPKIKGFAKLNHRQRTLLYSTALRPEFRELEESFLFTQWTVLNGSFPESEYYNMISDLYGDPFEETFDEKGFNKLWLISRRVVTQCSIFNVSVDYYVSRIELFYRNLDYELLVHQLESEVDYASAIPKKDICYLPYLIDPLFNDRSFGNGALVRLQFGLPDNSPDLDVTLCPDYVSYKSAMVDRYSSSHKVRVKNEYVATSQAAQRIRASLSNILFTKFY